MSYTTLDPTAHETLKSEVDLLLDWIQQETLRLQQEAVEVYAASVHIEPGIGFGVVVGNVSTGAAWAAMTTHDNGHWDVSARSMSGQTYSQRYAAGEQSASQAVINLLQHTKLMEEAATKIPPQNLFYA